MMNKRLFCILLLVSTVWLAYTQTRDYIPLQKQVGPEHTTEDIATVQAPFAMPEMNRPVFKDVVCSIVETGAKPEKMVTKAIQKSVVTEEEKWSYLPVFGKRVA